MTGTVNTGGRYTEESIKQVLTTAHLKRKNDDLEFFKTKLTEVIKAKPDRAVFILKKWLER